MTTKEFTIEQAKQRVNAAKESANALSDEAKAAAYSAIETMEAKINELEATDENVDLDGLKNELISIMDEKLAAITEKQEQEQEKTETMENYLDSKNALHDFLEVCRQSHNSADFKARWSAKAQENGVAFTDTTGQVGFLPALVKGAINDAWERSGWVNRLKYVNAQRYAIRWNTSTQTAETSRAKGHVNGQNKTGETITLNTKVLDPKFLYKIIDIDNLTIWQDDNSLLRYIADECTRQWYYEVGRAVLIGDGRSSATPDLRVQSIESVISANSAFSTKIVETVAAAKAPTLAELVNLRANVVEDAEDCVLFISRKNLNTLREYTAASGGTKTYIPVQDIADMIGVKEIICTDLLDTTNYSTDNQPMAIVMDLKGYAICGANAPAFKSDEDIKTNVQTWRYENPIAGGVEKPKSVAWLAYDAA